VFFGDDLGAADEDVDLCSAFSECFGQPGSLCRAEELRVLGFVVIGKIAVVQQDDFDAPPVGTEVVSSVDTLALTARVVSGDAGEIKGEVLRYCFERVAGMCIFPTVVMIVPCCQGRELLTKGGVVGLVELLLVFGFDH
jgi:hypothetical protein